MTDDRRLKMAEEPEIVQLTLSSTNSTFNASASSAYVTVYNNGSVLKDSAVSVNKNGSISTVSYDPSNGRVTFTWDANTSETSTRTGTITVTYKTGSVTHNWTQQKDAVSHTYYSAVKEYPNDITGYSRIQIIMPTREMCIYMYGKSMRAEGYYGDEYYSGKRVQKGYTTWYDAYAGNSYDVLYYSSHNWRPDTIYTTTLEGFTFEYWFESGRDGWVNGYIREQGNDTILDTTRAYAWPDTGSYEM